MPISHVVNKRLLQLSLPPLLLARFLPDLIVALQEILCQSSFALMRFILQKIMHFQTI